MICFRKEEDPKQNLTFRFAFFSVRQCQYCNQSETDQSKVTPSDRSTQNSTVNRYRASERAIHSTAKKYQNPSFILGALCCEIDSYRLSRVCVRVEVTSTFRGRALHSSFLFVSEYKTVSIVDCLGSLFCGCTGLFFYLVH